ncbi:MAG: DUF222 domain-containing protein [Actinobacteria bacterium]|nr:DUF222 domain-containing protein [Actinomycetota bacterium]
MRNSHSRRRRGRGATDTSADTSVGAVSVVRVPCVDSFVVLAQTDPFSLPADAQVELLQDFERHVAWVESLRVDALAAMAGPGPDYTPDTGDAETRRNGLEVNDSVRDEAMAALRVSGRMAEFRITTARDLHFKLPRTRQLLRDGAASMAHVNAIVGECERLSVTQARKVEARALNRVGEQTPAQTRSSVRRAAARLYPVTAEQGLDKEFARRKVTFSRDGSVMATVTATLPAPDAVAVWNALTATASQANPPRASSCTDPGDTTPAPGAVDRRTMDHKRADALASWAQRATDDDSLPTMQGKKRLETQVVIDVETLLGLADNPGELLGFGPIPAELARRLAADSGGWRRLVTDPVSGHLLDYGTSRYEPPAALREYIIARDRTCQFPGCARASYRCDLDHVTPYTGPGDNGDSSENEGGATSADNLYTELWHHSHHDHQERRDLLPHLIGSTRRTRWSGTSAVRLRTARNPPRSRCRLYLHR